MKTKEAILVYVVYAVTLTLMTVVLIVALQRQPVQSVRTVDVYAAEAKASAQLKDLGDGWECWAEVNSDQVDGYEVLCNRVDITLPPK